MDLSTSQTNGPRRCTLAAAKGRKRTVSPPFHKSNYPFAAFSRAGPRLSVLRIPVHSGPLFRFEAGRGSGQSPVGFRRVWRFRLGQSLGTLMPAKRTDHAIDKTDAAACAGRGQRAGDRMHARRGAQHDTGQPQARRDRRARLAIGRRPDERGP